MTLHLFRSSASRDRAAVAAVSPGTVAPVTPAPVRPPIPPVAPPGIAPPTTPSPAQPTLTEFIALLHHETQQVVEHLAEANLHLVSPASPSAALVKIESVRLDIPMRVLVETVSATPQEIAALPILLRPFPIPRLPNQALVLRVAIQGTPSPETTVREGTLSVEFSIAAK